MTRTKQITLGDRTYEVRRFTPAVGSYAWQLLTRSVINMRNEVDDTEAPDDAKPQTLEPEARLRGVCAIAFMSMKFEDFEFLQNHCLKVISVIENGLPMPVMTIEGRWDPKAEEAIGGNPSLLTKLMVEVLVFNLASFLE